MANNEYEDKATIQNKTAPPPGTVPRNMQGKLIAGIALVMTAIIAFSGSNAPPPKKPTEAAPVAVADPSRPRIEDYKTRIDQQVKKLKEEQDQLNKQMAVATVANMPESRMQPYATRVGDYSRSQTYIPAVAEKSWVDQDSEKRNHQSLFAPIVALNIRDKYETQAETRGGPIPSLRRAVTPVNYSPVDADNVSTAANTKEKSDEKRKAHESVNQAVGNRYRLFEGTVIETTLTDRLDGAFSGPVNCMVTNDIYSHDRQHLLIPAGSRVLGEVKRVDAFGQQRLAVVFHRLIMPDGYNLSLDQFRGLNQIGETGLKDKVDNHWTQILGVSVAVGIIGGLSQSTSRFGVDASPIDAYRQGVAASVSQSSLRILDRFLSVLPSITIREGQRVKVYLADDLELPAYENHRMPNEL